MGFPVSLRIDDKDVPEGLADAVFGWLQEADRRFSPFRPDSEVSRLDRGDTGPDDISADLAEVLLLSERYRTETGGAFDIRLPGRGLDPSAVVKGWSVQRAALLLKEAGVRRFCLNAGGDVVVGGGPWRVGVRHPEISDQVCVVLELDDGAVATSARYERGNHIVDGRTGLPATDLLSLTVVAPTLTEADATATAAFALGVEGIAWASAREGCEVFAVDADRRVRRSGGLPVADRDEEAEQAVASVPDSASVPPGTTAPPVSPRAPLATATGGRAATDRKRRMSRRSLLAAGGAGVTAIGLSGVHLATTGSEAAATVTASASGSPSAPDLLPLVKETTEGPYYLDYDKHRVDITEGRPGTPLELRIQVLNAKNGKPVPEAAVDIWQCDALGIYSGYEETSEAMNEGELVFDGPIPKLPPDSKTTYLRGFQMTGRDGWVRFRTVFPGWYTGRTVHIHAKVHTRGVLLDRAYAQGVTVHTGQVFFPEDLTAAVSRVRPYTRNDLPRTTNATDPFYSGDTAADGLLTVEWDRTDATRPIRASIRTAVDLEAINPGRRGNPPPGPVRPGA